ncbi:WD40 repeat domain-containing protein [Marinobacter sp. G11]|uniref:WD40 repeat domain-containing protein n=1 Tax=Marinobacter sp. G11 TaxID=2903522 RepID=UPI001E576D53|nr:WD40 repeat domain-containing protein [Marinobacter sp. G11]MCE0759245.1 WD40 repeat domain-containing protein [Marinobacter sp. G11]
MANKKAFISVGEYQNFRALIGPDYSLSLAGPSVSGNTSGAAFSSDGSLLAVTCRSAPYLKVFNTGDWSEVTGPGMSIAGKRCAFSPDGTQIAVSHWGDNNFTVLATSDWSTISGSASVPGNGNSCAFSPDGGLLAVTHYSSPYITVFNTSDWSKVSGIASVPGTAWDCAFSPDGAFLAVCHSGSPRVTVYNTSDWTKVGVSGLPFDGRGCDFSPNGAWLAVAHWNSPYITVYNTSDWTKVSGLSASIGDSFDCKFSHDSSQLAVLGYNGPRIEVFDTSNWSALPEVASIPENSETLAASPQAGITVPARKIETRQSDGQDLNATVIVSTRSLQKVTDIASSGAAEFQSLIAGDYWLIMRDDREGATSDAFARITLDATSGDLPPLVLTQGYIGDLVTISSNLTTQAGAPGDEVVIRNWTTRELVAKVIPDANGDWSAEVPPGTYDVSYIAENCAPVIHGPYTVELP